MSINIPIVVVDEAISPPAYPLPNDKWLVLPPAAMAWLGHDNQIARWTGADWAFQSPDIGQIVYDLECDVYYIWDGTSFQPVPTMLPHHQLIDYDANDDHLQYAKLSGRVGGQALVGGSNAGNSLSLQSTSHATRGTINVLDRMTRPGNALKMGSYGTPSTGEDVEGNVFFGGDVEVAGVGVFSGSTQGISHNQLDNRSADGHTQYALLIGRAGGQTVKGGVAASENLNLESTAHGTKGCVVTKSTLKREAGLIVSGRRLTHSDSPATMLDADQWLCTDTTSGEILFNLPTSLAVFGRMVEFTDIGLASDYVTIRPEFPAQIVDPVTGVLAAECVLAPAGATFSFRFDSENWRAV